MVPQRWGDGACDEFANNKVFNYDGGDCCLPVASKQHFFNHVDMNTWSNDFYDDTEKVQSNLICHKTGDKVAQFYGNHFKTRCPKPLGCWGHAALGFEVSNDRHVESTINDVTDNQVVYFVTDTLVVYDTIIRTDTVTDNQIVYFVTDTKIVYFVTDIQVVY